MAASGLDQAQAARFARLALDCVHKEYPNKIAHSMNSDADVKPPRELAPAFYGCYDWHSSVHGHWLLVRLVRLFPQASFAVEARKALAQSLPPNRILSPRKSQVRRARYPPLETHAIRHNRSRSRTTIPLRARVPT